MVKILHCNAGSYFVIIIILSSSTVLRNTFWRDTIFKNITMPDSRNDLIKLYFDKGYTYQEIVDILAKSHEITISLRQLKRVLKELELKRKNISESELEDVVAAIMKELENSGSCIGYKMLWLRLKQIHGLNVKRDHVLEILRIIDPEGIEERSKHSLKKRVYKVPGPNFIWHLDGMDKLKFAGFAIHGAIDGYSRRILWLHVGTTNNKPEIVVMLYLETLKKRKLMPRLLRSDRGTENSLIKCIHQSLRMDHDDKLSGYSSYLIGKSTSNQRIESFWCQLRRQGIDFWIKLFKDMRDNGLFDDSDVLHVELLRYCFGPLIKYDLEIIKDQWNTHKIRKQANTETVSGKPNCLYFLPEKYNARDMKKEIDEEAIDMLQIEYGIKPQLWLPETEELVTVLMPDFEAPTDTEEALAVYATLIDRLKESDNNDTENA